MKPLDTTEHRNTFWLLIGMALLLLALKFSPPFAFLQGTDIMPLPMHIAAETFAIVVAMLIFAVTWNAYEEGRATNTLILASGFFVIGLLDFGHLLSFKGMPDFVTPSDPEKAIQFWLAGRLVSALLLLAVSLMPWYPLSNPRSRYALLAASFLVTASFYWLVLFHQQDLPHTFIEGSGLTPLKIGSEYVVIAIFGIAAVLFFRQARESGDDGHNSFNLFVACVITILSELCFVLYSAVSDIFNLLGHLYKAVAYLYIYRAVFIDSVRGPYIRLKRTERNLSDAKMMKQSIINNVPVRIFWKDRNSRYLGANKLFLQDVGAGDLDELLGKDDLAFFPKETAEQFRSDDREVIGNGIPKLNIEESLKTPDGRTTWLLTNKVPMKSQDGDVVGVLGAYLDITHLRDMEQKLEESNTQLRELTIRREEAREAERRRIAQDLHDELGQMLTTLRLEASLCRIQHGADNPPLLARLQNLIEHIDATIQVVRNVASQLRPAVLDMGIVPALEWRVAEFTQHSGIACTLTVGSGDIHLDMDQASNVYRIVQESLTNIMRHAGAGKVEIRLERLGGGYLLEVRDDGVGFEPDLPGKKTFGLMGIRERALVLGGSLDIISAPGRGTTLSIRFPMANGREHS